MFFELLLTRVEGKEFDLRQVIGEGDDVVLVGCMGFEVRKTGRGIDTVLALHTAVRDGRITGRASAGSGSWRPPCGRA